MEIPFPEPRRLTLTIRSRGRSAELAALAFGDPDGPPEVVFLHANGFNALTYRQALAPLAPRLRILAFDQQGHGGSTLRADPDGRADWRDLRDDLLGVLEALDGPPVVLAGHSLGGTVSLMAASEAPARVKALALFDPVLFPPRPPDA